MHYILFIQTISIAPLQVYYRYYSEVLPTQHEVPQATVSEGLAQGSYVAARAGVEHMTLRMKGVESTNAPPTPHVYHLTLFLIKHLL